MINHIRIYLLCICTCRYNDTYLHTSKWMFFSKYCKNARLQFTFNASSLVRYLGMIADETVLLNFKRTLEIQGDLAPCCQSQSFAEFRMWFQHLT